MNIKGEWIKTDDSSMVVQVDHSGASTVCEMNEHIEGFEDFGNLIAAAPDLLEACKTALRWHSGDKWRYSKDETEVVSWECTNKALEQAINKAEGN